MQIIQTNRQSQDNHRDALKCLGFGSACLLLTASLVSPQQGGPGHVQAYNLVAEYLDPGAGIGRGSVAAIGDLDGNGVTDIVVEDGTQVDAVFVLLMSDQGRVISSLRMGINGTAGFGGNVMVGDDFGNAVEGIGDLDGDGIPDLAVGAEDDTEGLLQTGSLWIVFMNPDGTVKGEQQINSEQGGFGGKLRDKDHFGRSIAGLGDMNGDGICDLAVGASFANGGPGTLGNDWGAVWILFMNADGTVQADQKIDSSNGGFGGQLSMGSGFGHALAPLGDLNGDGVHDLAVSEIGSLDPNGRPIGAVWILFLNPDGTVISEQEIGPATGGFTGQLDPNDGFSYQLAHLQDIDHDNIDDLAVSAWVDDDGGTTSGAIWILFLNTDGTVKGQQKISKTMGSFTGDFETQLGGSMDSLGDFDGDGVEDLIASSVIFDDMGFVRSGQWMLFLDDGEVSASFVYGSGVNPDDSLIVEDGRPSIGTTTTIGLDNPLGTQSVGANTLLILSLASDPNFPAGTLIPNFGMIAFGASGELLISALPSDLIAPALVGPAWLGSGLPSSIDVDVPSDLTLIGLSVYAQGVLIDPLSTGSSVKFGLTEAVELRIGA